MGTGIYGSDINDPNGQLRGNDKPYQGQSPAEQAANNAAAAPGGSGSDYGVGHSINSEGSWAGTSNDADVDRYRSLGAATQPAAQLDQTQANESRGLMMGGLGLLKAQGDGSAPSAAGILSQRANENAAMQGARAGAGARSIGGAIAGINNASAGASGQALATNAQNAGTRAQEISHGQGAYASGASNMEGQDIQAAAANAQYQAQQNALNQQRQQGYERLGWNTRNAALQGDAQIHQQNTAQQQADLAAKRAGHAADVERVKDIYGGTTGIVTGLLSDERVKSGIVPMGSLASLFRKGKR